MLAELGRSCLIDGEVAVCRPDGVVDFEPLRSGPQRKPKAMLYAFDLSELDGGICGPSHCGAKTKVRRLLAETKSGIRLCRHIEGNGPSAFQHACAMGLEGPLSKRKK